MNRLLLGTLLWCVTVPAVVRAEAQPPRAVREARSLLDRALKLSQRKPATTSDRDYLLATIARAELSAGDVHSAVSVALLIQDDRKTWALRDILTTQATHDDIRGALATDAALDANNIDDDEVLPLIASAQARAGDWRGMHRTLTWIHDDANWNGALYSIADVHLSAGHVARALETMKQVRKSDANAPDVDWTAVACAQMRRGDAASAHRTAARENFEAFLLSIETDQIKQGRLRAAYLTIATTRRPRGTKGFFERTREWTKLAEAEGKRGHRLACLHDLQRARHYARLVPPDEEHWGGNDPINHAFSSIALLEARFGFRQHARRNIRDMVQLGTRYPVVPKNMSIPLLLPQDLVGLAATMAKQGDYIHARYAAEQIDNDDNQSAMAWADIAIEEARAGQRRLAERDFQRACRAARRADGSMQGDAFSQIAEELARHGEFDMAFRAFRQTSTDALSMKGDVFSEIATSQAAHGRFRDAWHTLFRMRGFKEWDEALMGVAEQEARDGQEQAVLNHLRVLPDPGDQATLLTGVARGLLMRAGRLEDPNAEDPNAETDDSQD